MKIKETIKEFYSYWIYLHLKRNGCEYYSKDFLFKQYKQSEPILSENKPAIINQAWLRGKCVYCGEKIESFKPIGDHVVAELKGMNIQGYELPCCQKCNSSKNNIDLLDWLEKNQHSIFDIHGTACMVYLRALWRLYKERKELNNDKDIILNKYLQKLRDVTTIMIDVKSFTKFEKKQQETFASLDTIKDDWETVEPDIIEYDVYDYPVPVYDGPPQNCKEVTPFLDENFDVLEAGRSDKKQCQLCGTKIDREWYFVCYEKNIYMKIGGICFENYSNIEKKELVKNTIWKMIKNHLIENKQSITKEYWGKWKNNKIHPKKLGYNFSMTLKTITENTHREVIGETMKNMIQLDMTIDDTLRGFIEKLHDRNYTTEMNRYYNRKYSDVQSNYIKNTPITQTNEKLGIEEFFWS